MLLWPYIVILSSGKRDKETRGHELEKEDHIWQQERESLGGAALLPPRRSEYIRNSEGGAGLENASKRVRKNWFPLLSNFAIERHVCDAFKHRDSYVKHICVYNVDLLWFPTGSRMSTITSLRRKNVMHKGSESSLVSHISLCLFFNSHIYEYLYYYIYI